MPHSLNLGSSVQSVRIYQWVALVNGSLVISGVLVKIGSLFFNGILCKTGSLDAMGVLSAHGSDEIIPEQV